MDTGPLFILVKKNSPCCGGLNFWPHAQLCQMVVYSIPEMCTSIGFEALETCWESLVCHVAFHSTLHCNGNHCLGHRVGALQFVHGTRLLA